MQAHSLIRVAVIGPESTGKTTLCRHLADHYGTVWVPEYARRYMERLDRPYALDDIVLTARRQAQHEQRLSRKASRLLFSDTECIVARIWCEDRYGTCPPWIERRISRRPYDLYLLTEPDLPWRPDPVRENPGRRKYLYRLYERELVHRGLRWARVHGRDEARFRLALKEVEGLVKSLR